MRYRILQNETAPVTPPEEVRDLRLRQTTIGTVYLDVSTIGGDWKAVLYLNSNRKIVIDKTHAAIVGLKFIGE